MREENALGISFSTRMLGLAIIRNHDLVQYSSKLYKDKWSPAKEDRMIADLASCIDYYNITVIILSIPLTHYLTNESKIIYQRIIQLAYEKHIKIKEMDKKSIRLLCQNTQKKNKRSQMEVLSHIYEELQPYCIKEIANKSKYYEKMFEAVGVATVYQYQN